MVKPSQVITDSITPAQISKCAKVLDCQTHQNVYFVENEAGNFDDDGHMIEYKVTYSKEKGFQCTCKAGQEGFIHCKNGYCKHVAWAVATAKEEKARETARLAKATAIVLTRSCGMEICDTPDCLQLASTITGKCVAHNGVVTDPGMLAFCKARKRGEDLNLGRPAWMMR